MLCKINSLICPLILTSFEALKTLSDSDFDLIYHLYLADERLTAREYAAKMKVCEAAISKKKKRIIKKLKKYFGYDG